MVALTLYVTAPNKNQNKETTTTQKKKPDKKHHETRIEISTQIYH